MSSDVIGFTALLLIAASAVALSITAVMALVRISHREAGPCQTPDKQTSRAPGRFTPMALSNLGPVILICTMLLTVMVIVVEHSSEIFPAGRIFSLGGVIAGLTLSVCLWRSSRQKCA